MTSYTQIFGGSTIYPSDVSYLALALDADTQMTWPIEADAGANIVAKIMDVTPSGLTPGGNNFSVIMPPASQTSVGQTVLFNNTGLYAFTVRDFANGQIAVVAPGEQWQVYITDNTTDAGSWVALNYGATTASVQPSALAGFGLTPIGTAIATATPVVTFNTTPLTLTDAQRASLYVWDGTGAGAVTLPSAPTVGSNYFVSLRNNGGGNLVISPAGVETINGLPSLTLTPSDSATLATDGLNWYSLGLGQNATFAFDYTLINVTGGTYTLAGVELNRIAYRFSGTLTSDCEVVVPATTQQYWVTNETTGAFTLGVKTATQVTPIDIPQGASAILYCDGTDVVLASAATSATPTVITVPYGGTGITSYTTGDLIYASGTTSLTKLAAVAANNVLHSNGVGAAPSWGKVILTTDVTGGGFNNSGVNTTTPVVYVEAVDAATNVDFAILPKGSGAIISAIPDGTTPGGNKRGTYAIDLQFGRSAATQVASGGYSAIIGGQLQTAASARSFIGGGGLASITGVVSTDSAIVGGFSCSITNGQGAFIGAGSSNAITANYAAIIGGGSNEANAQYSSIVGGRYATARSVYGAEARSNGRFSVTGDAQRSSHILRAQSVGPVSPTTLTLTTFGSGGASATTQVALPNNSAFSYEITIIVKTSSGPNDGAAFKIEGLIVRGANAASTALIGTPIYTTLGNSFGGSIVPGTDFYVQADTTNGCLQVIAKGFAFTTTNWVAHVRTVEVVA